MCFWGGVGKRLQTSQVNQRLEIALEYRKVVQCFIEHKCDFFSYSKVCQLFIQLTILANDHGSK